LVALATIPELSPTAKAIIQGLVGTITNWEDWWKREKSLMEKEINELGFKVGLLKERDEEEAPNGYIANKGYVDISLPIRGDYA
jgi:hypothetical protein